MTPRVRAAVEQAKALTKTDAGSAVNALAMELLALSQDSLNHDELCGVKAWEAVYHLMALHTGFGHCTTCAKALSNMAHHEECRAGMQPGAYRALVKALVEYSGHESLGPAVAVAQWNLEAKGKLRALV